MKALPNEQRKRLYVIAAVSAGVLLCIWLGPVSMLRDQLVVNHRMTREQEHKITNAKRLMSEKVAMEQNLLTASNTLQAAEDAMPAGDLYAWMYTTVNKFRANYKVELPQIGRELIGEVGMFPGYPYRAATFTVQGTAQFHELGKFVADLENAFPYMRLQNFEIEPAGADAGAAAELLKFKMDIVSLVNPNSR